jgi:FkbM family methyltransferase
MAKLDKLLKKWRRRFLSAFGYRLIKVDKLDVNFESILYRGLRTSNDFFFVQIGANDGQDHIYEFVSKNHDQVSGMVIEPLKDMFDELAYKYRKFSKITPLNVAIHNSETEMTLYRIAPQKLKTLPGWLKGISSFNQDHHKLTNTPSSWIIPVTVPCVSLQELFNRYRIKKVDLLQIDTEGYDAQIILNLDFNAIQPTIIRFEHGVPDNIMSKEALRQLLDFLHQHGYEVLVEPNDATAYRLELMIASGP